MIEKIRNRTEEEAKAALAERRRLAREQAEREAELERLRLVSYLIVFCTRINSILVFLIVLQLVQTENTV